MRGPEPGVRRPSETEEYFFAEGCHILETWNRGDDPAVSIARVRVPAGTSTRPHRLEGIAERYLILSGRGQAQVGDLPAQVVGPGDLVYIPPGCSQRIAAIEPDELVFLAVCTPRFVAEAYEDLTDGYREDGRRRSSPPSPPGGGPG